LGIVLLVLTVVVIVFGRAWMAVSAENRTLREEKVRAEEQANAARQAIENERQTLQRAQEAFKETFEGLAARALRSNNEAFINLAKEQLESATKDAAVKFGEKSAEITNLVKPLKETLDKYEQAAREMEAERQRAYSDVRQHLVQVVQVTERVGKEAEGLKAALSRPRTRGNWGEMALRACVEAAGMTDATGGCVHFQDTTRTEDTHIRPDMTVDMPNGRKIVVDAKTPMDAWQELLKPGLTEEQRAAVLTRHGAQMKAHVDGLANKEYFEKVAGSPDFVVLFLPNESFLYAALEAQPNLMEYAIGKKVLICSPPTLVGLLKVIWFGWREVKQEENARKISEVGQELHKRVVDFLNNLADIGRTLERAQKHFDAAIYNARSKIVPQAQKLEALGAKSQKDLPELDLRALPVGEAESEFKEDGVAADLFEER
jgi:DNA recombination protein RmuC